MRNFVDLFSGGGLGARGAVQAGMTPLVAVDCWDIACRTYEANFPAAKVLNARVEEVDPLLHVSPSSVDLLLASPECTNHSPAKGSAPRDERSRETVMLTVSWIAALRPRWFVIENVKQMRGWHRYGELLDTLRALGYRMCEQVIDAADFGAPQARVRLFLIGGFGIEPPRLFRQSAGRRPAREILDADGIWPMSPLFSERRAANTVARARNAIRALGRDAEFLLVYYGSGGENTWQTLDQPLRTITTIDRFALVQKCRGRYMIRMLQPTELARAMALPPEHVFPFGTRRDKVRLCGNGVCANVVREIVRHLRLADQGSGFVGETIALNGRYEGGTTAPAAV